VADAAGFIADLKEGAYDADLTLIREAVHERCNRWRITFEGEIIDRDTITVGEAYKFFEVRFGKDFNQADPVLWTADRVALLCVRMMSKDDSLKTVDDAMQALKSKPLNTAIVTEYIEDDASLPKDA
jgi:hypothetical protein